ncbi:tRNA (adenosine(37)-N6)-threonylcarbamoyltransferase complex ATPase subunit type 1 TsaE [Gammaproteobacteria bacterium AB-CW1]|uniref:tRNA threonylcarbamoyladenosine biosynthesis protein TsaE n=1 Tax=Natronospira elongata TaxID=3110268 RepID=A0AAP6JFW4_9GAMM|nr:tRNA (adenosine(37)-N6)-threonylcarbamoyltransferase complex ATPase subunit type 1 TsaE [Gammaproteobacteria bacterium AB-CW1]
MSELELHLPREEGTQALGAALAELLPPGEGLVIYLSGQLGAGKTSLCRAFLRALGESGPVRSPTYTLMEPYEPAGRRVWHMDLYRLADPEELEFIGIRDMDASDLVLLVEWPERGRGLLPEADCEIALEHAQAGRLATLKALGPRGASLLAGLPSRLRDEADIALDKPQ